MRTETLGMTDERYQELRRILEDRRDEIAYHVGRPGEDLYTERVLQTWGIDGHNSHTNVCSAGARAGYAFWMGMDRPNPDHENAKFVLMLSAHLESGHYFIPQAQRIIGAQMGGAKTAVIDTRLSNTASKADYWLSPHPGTESGLLLALANQLLMHGWGSLTKSPKTPMRAPSLLLRRSLSAASLRSWGR